MSANIQRYAPSGAFSPMTFVYAIGAMVAAIVVAGIYQLLVNFIPFIYINALLTLAFSGVLAVMLSMALSSGHCRNKTVGLALGLLMGAVGLAATYGWSFLLAVNSARSDSGMTLMQFAREVGFDRWVDIRLEGGWRVRSIEITGMGVMVIWAIEGLMVLAGPLLFGAVAAAEPYCEPCQAWTQSQDARIKGLTREEAQPLVDRGNLAGLLALAEQPEANASCCIQLQRRFCPQCANTAFLTVQEIRTTLNKEGKEEEKKTELLENAVLNSKLNAQYIARFHNPYLDAAPSTGAAV